MIRTNMNAKPTFIEDAYMDATNGAELWAKYDGSNDYLITLMEGALEAWCFDGEALDEAIEFFTTLRDDLIKRREG